MASVPLSTLRSLSITVHAASWADLSNHVEQCQNIEELGLHGSLSSDPSRTSSLSLRSLAKLTVTPVFLRHCLKHVLTPNLEELIVTARNETFDLTTRILSDVLRTVRFMGANMETSMLCAVLTPHTTIRTIIIDHRSSKYHLLFAMLLGIAGGPTGWTEYALAEPPSLCPSNYSKFDRGSGEQTLLH